MIWDKINCDFEFLYFKYLMVGKYIGDLRKWCMPKLKVLVYYVPIICP